MIYTIPEIHMYYAFLTIPEMHDTELSISDYTKYKIPSAAIKVLSVPGRGPRVVVSTTAFHARVRGSVPDRGGLKETKNVSSPSTCESQYCGEPP